MPVKTKDQLKSELDATIFDNPGGGITPELVHALLLDTIDSLPIQGIYDPFNLSQYSGASDCTAALQAIIDQCFGPASSPNGKDNAKLNKPFVIPPGEFNISSPLVFTKVHGGLIQGGGKHATNIINTAGGNVFQTNGFEYTKVERLKLTGNSGTGDLFKLDWDGSFGPALQSNTFADVYFEGGLNGLSIGISGFMGSENLIFNCFFNNQEGDGLGTWNYNALQNTVIGGNFQSNLYGIHIRYGSAPIIIGVGFQENSQDIMIDNTANDTYSISGCRTESPDFFKSLQSVSKVVITGCNQICSMSGNFAYCNGAVIIDGCYSQNGQITGAQSGKWHLRNSDWGRSDYIIDNGSNGLVIGALNEDGNVRSTTGSWTSSFTLSAPYFNGLGGIFDIDSATAVTITIPPNSSVPLPVGVEYQFYQKGLGQAVIAAGSGVAVRAPGLRMTRAQFSTIYIRQRATDEWVLSGDLASVGVVTAVGSAAGSASATATSGNFPLSLSPLLWFDASDAASITISSGSSVAQWNDKSGNNNHAVQSTGSAQPTVQTAAQNGLNTLRFTQASSQLFNLTSRVSVGTSSTLVAVMRRGGPSGTNWLNVFGDSVNIANYVFEWYSDARIYCQGAAGGTETDSVTESSTGYNSVIVPTGQILFNGADATSGTAAGGGSGFIDCIGNGDTGGRMNGELAEIMAFARVLNSTELTALQGYLRAKWGTP